MKARLTSGLWSVALGSLLLASHAAAQTPVQSFADLSPLLKPGQDIIVTDGKGVKTAGKVVAIRGTQLELEDGRLKYAFSEDSVRRIQLDDGLWTGKIIGFAVGLLGAHAYVVNCRSTPYDRRASSCETAEYSYIYEPFLGWLVGGLVDGAIKKTLFVSSRPSAISMAPLLGRARVGVAATIRF